MSENNRLIMIAMTAFVTSTGLLMLYKHRKRNEEIQNAFPTLSKVLEIMDVNEIVKEMKRNEGIDYINSREDLKKIEGASISHCMNTLKSRMEWKYLTKDEQKTFGAKVRDLFQNHLKESILSKELSQLKAVLDETNEIWYFFEHLDSGAFDVGRYSDATIAELIKKCVEVDGTAFNTKGWIKYDVRPMEQWNVFGRSKPSGIFLQHGLYVRESKLSVEHEVRMAENKTVFKPNQSNHPEEIIECSNPPCFMKV